MDKTLKKRAHIFLHVNFESPAEIEVWLITQGFDIFYTRFFEPHTLPIINDVDWLVIMGGPMSVNDEQEYPWLKDEKKFVSDCIHAGKIVVGVCLGAQIIAASFGKKVYPSAHKEIGWFPISFNTSAPGNLPSTLTVFHWHGETFDLPDNAQLIALSAGCKNQIFLLGKNVLGMQCHLEMNRQAVENILYHCSHELQPAEYIQNAAEITSGTEKFSYQANQVLFSLLNSLKEQH